MHQELRRGTKMIPVVLVLSCLLTLLGYAAGRDLRSEETAAPPAEPGPQSGAQAGPADTPAPREEAAPEAGPQPVPDGGSGKETAPADEPLPRIIRTVCTDHICGGCDGKCHLKSGHVAIDKKGHCACTPTEGSALDRATRQAYAKNQPE